MTLRSCKIHKGFSLVTPSQKKSQCRQTFQSGPNIDYLHRYNSAGRALVLTVLLGFQSYDVLVAETFWDDMDRVQATLKLYYELRHIIMVQWKLQSYFLLLEKGAVLAEELDSNFRGNSFLLHQ
jgi:hypothetical protein